MPMRCGSSGSVTAVKPRVALRRISLAASLGIGEERDAHRDDAVGMRRVPLVEEPVVPRARAREPELGIAQRENTEPQKPVICDGKLTDAHTPLMSMSRTRASTS